MFSKRLFISSGLPLVTALAGLVIVLYWWSGAGIQRQLTERVPGIDRPADETNAGAAKWEGKLIKSNGVPANLPGSWPCFRGTNFDGICTDPTPLARSWGPDGPKALWTVDVGEGFAGPAIWKGRVYLVDYDHQAQADAIRCLSLADGQEIWRYSYPVKIKRNHGMSRTMPAITDKYLVAIGPKCQVVCLDPDSGEFRWVHQLVREFNATVPDWYAGQCPLIDGNRAIIATGGDALLIAIDCQTGQVVWQSPNPRNWQMTHSSVIPMDYQGRRMYVYCGSEGVAGVSATDGALLWDTPDWKIKIATVPSPVPVGGGKIFLSGGYNAGALMLQVKEQDGKYSVETLYRLRPSIFGAIQHTPICYQQHLFGVKTDGQLVCLDLQGQVLWSSGSGPDRRFGGGPFLIAQNLLWVMNDSGTLTLAEAGTNGYRPLAQAKVVPGPDSWGPMALAGGRLIVRDLYKMTCLDVAAK
jgi:outer membrane protein assembly factor BamB